MSKLFYSRFDRLFESRQSKIQQKETFKKFKFFPKKKKKYFSTRIKIVRGWHSWPNWYLTIERMGIKIIVTDTMVLLSLIITTSIFVRYFVQIGMTRMGILPIAILVALFFWSGIQSSHKSGIKSYIELHLQSLSRILINSGFLIIMSLYTIWWALWALYCIIFNAFLLWIMYLLGNDEWKPAMRWAIVFCSGVYTLSVWYTCYLVWSWDSFISLIGMLIGLLAAFRSVYYFIIWYFVDTRASNLRYELFLIYHCFCIIMILKIYFLQDPFTGLILIQWYIAWVLFVLSKAKSVQPDFYLSHDDINIEYIMRWYKINQIPTKKNTPIKNIFSSPRLQDFIKHVPSLILSTLSISSIVITLLFCALTLWIWQTDTLVLQDFMLFLLNILLYLCIFYLCKVIGIQDKLRRFFWFIAINICYFIVVAQVFSGDVVSILFWSILRSVSNNLALNYMQDLKSYLGQADYQYRLMSNFFGLLIILYFFLWINFDILLKLAFVVMIVGIRLLLNKDNLKSMMEKKGEVQPAWTHQDHGHTDSHDHHAHH